MQNIQLSHMRWCHYRTVTKEAFWDITMCLWVSGSWHPKDCNAFILMWTQPTMIKRTTPQNIRNNSPTHTASDLRRQESACTQAVECWTQERLLVFHSRNSWTFWNGKFKLTLGQFCLCLLMVVLDDSSNSLCKFQSLCCDFHKGNCSQKDHHTCLLSFWEFPTSFFNCIFHVHSTNLVTEEY